MQRTGSGNNTFRIPPMQRTGSSNLNISNATHACKLEHKNLKRNYLERRGEKANYLITPKLNKSEKHKSSQSGASV